MNIGIVTQWFPSGAGHVSKKYRETLELEHNVFIYARGGKLMKNDKEWDDANVTWAPYHPCLTGIYFKSFRLWVKKNNIQVVLFNEQRYWKALYFAKKLNLLTGAYIDYYKQDTIELFHNYDFLISNTLRHYSVFNNFFQSFYIKWGTFENEKYFKEFNIPSSKLNFIISSGWDGKYSRNTPWLDRRGTGLVLNTFDKFQFNCNLIVYSQVSLSDCPNEWKEIISRNNNIIFKYGSFSPFPYHDGDVYLYPSRLDGIGLTLPEAISNGLPAITTNCAPMNEFVEDNFNGFLINVENTIARPDGYYWPESICSINSLAENINKYISNPELLLKHSNGSRKKAVTDLNWEVNSCKFSEQIKTLIKKEQSLKLLLSKCREQDKKDAPSPIDYIIFSIKGLINLFLKL